MKVRIHRPIWGVPITYLGVHCPSQFEITPFPVGSNQTLLPGMIKNAEGLINGKATYARILIKQK